MARLDAVQLGALAVQRGYVTVEQLLPIVEEHARQGGGDGRALLVRLSEARLLTARQAEDLMSGAEPVEGPPGPPEPAARDGSTASAAPDSGPPSPEPAGKPDPDDAPPVVLRPTPRARPVARRAATTRPEGSKHGEREHVTVIPAPDNRPTIPPDAVEEATPPPTAGEVAERARRILDETRAARNSLTRSERVGSRTPTEPPVAVGAAAAVDTGSGKTGRAASLAVKPLLRRTPVSLLSLPEDAELGGPAVVRDGKYLIGKEVGRGGMGLVRIAEDLDLGRQVAIKTLLAGPGADERMLRALINEARTTGQLQHPNIIPVHDIGVLSSGEVYYTMKLVGHQSLRDVVHGLSRGDRTVTSEYTLVRLLGVVQHLAMALHYAHSRGVVHRDLKPENVLLGSFGEVHLMDWGIAKIIGRTTPLEGTSYASDGFVAGTPAYMSPEQARGDYTAVDERSDIYSLGVILYELLTLELPLEPTEKAEDLGRAKEQDVEPPSVRTPNRRITPDLDVICLKALSIDPEERYQDARAMWRDIELHLEGNKERERLHQRAEEELRRARAGALRYRELMAEQQRLTAEVDSAERRLTPWDAESERMRLWRQRNRVGLLELAIGRAFAEAVKHYNRALGYDPEHEEARLGLSGLYESQSVAAERKHDLATMVYFGDLQQELVGGGGGSGRLTIRSYPGGARLHLLPAEALDGEIELSDHTLLGVTPIHEQEVEPGGYMIVATLEGHRETFLPVVVRPQETNAVLVRLHPASADVPLVGKEEELGRLRVMLRSVVDRHMLRSVLVAGSSGIGKSRLLGAFDDHVQDLPDVILYVQVECRRLYRWVPFSGVAELLRYRAGIVPGDSPELMRERVGEMVGYAFGGLSAGRVSLPPDLAEQAEGLAERLLRMPGLLASWDMELPADLADPTHDVTEAVVELFDRLSQQKPMIVYVHDMHHMDRTSRAIVETVLRRLPTAPMLVVATCNTDELGAEQLDPVPFHERLRLQGLRREGVAQLLREILKAPVSEDLVHRVHRHTGGSPHAVEATLRMLLQERHVELHGSEYALVPSASALLHGAFDATAEVMRRLEALGEVERHAVRAASVVGDAFWTGALRALGIANARDVVRRLIKAQFVARHPMSQFSGFDEFRFKQIGARDAVYGTIPDEERRRLHGLLVPWLESRPERGPVWLAAMAEHLVGAGESARAAEVHLRMADAAERFASWGDASMHVRRAAELADGMSQRAGLLERMADLMARGGGAPPPEGTLRIVVAERPPEDE